MVDVSDRDGAPESTIRQLVTATAYDLKTPLVLIGGLASQLKNPDLTEFERTKIISQIELTSNRIMQTCESVICASNASLKSSYLVEPISLPMIIEEVAHSYNDFAREHDQVIRIKRGTHKTPLVMANREGLSFILSNIMDLAIRYSRAGGVITFKTRRLGSEVKASITDSSPPITQSEFQTSLKLVGRANQPLKEHAGSGGSQLFASHHLGAMMNGLFGIDQISGGNAYYVRLPVSEQLRLL